LNVDTGHVLTLPLEELDVAGDPTGALRTIEMSERTARATEKRIVQQMLRVKAEMWE